MSTVTEEQIAKHKTARPGAELHVLSAPRFGIEVLVRAPDDGEWTRFRTLQAKDGHRIIALKALLGGCILEPSATEFAAIATNRPGLVEVFAAKLVEIAGASEEAEQRKV